jgi:hypothetical protein
MLAIGKESVPVRIAESTASSEAILFACKKAIDEGASSLLGLPMMCQPQMNGKSVSLDSLIAAEVDVRGYAIDVEGVLAKVKVVETLNPCARGFRALKINPMT